MATFVDDMKLYWVVKVQKTLQRSSQKGYRCGWHAVPIVFGDCCDPGMLHHCWVGGLHNILGLTDTVQHAPNVRQALAYVFWAVRAEHCR